MSDERDTYTMLYYAMKGIEQDLPPHKRAVARNVQRAFLRRVGKIDPARGAAAVAAFAKGIEIRRALKYLEEE